MSDYGQPEESEYVDEVQVPATGPAKLNLSPKTLTISALVILAGGLIVWTLMEFTKVKGASNAAVTSGTA